jgi:hypothetical protein
MLKNGFLNHKFNDEGISHFWAKYLMNSISNDFSNELLKFPTKKQQLTTKTSGFRIRSFCWNLENQLKQLSY